MLVAALHGLRQANLVLRRQQRNPTNLIQVPPHRVARRLAAVLRRWSTLRRSAGLPPPALRRSRNLVQAVLDPHHLIQHQLISDPGARLGLPPHRHRLNRVRCHLGSHRPLALSRHSLASRSRTSLSAAGFLRVLPPDD